MKNQDSSKSANQPQQTENTNMPDEEIVLPDECGDTLWDKVLEETEKRDELKKIILGEVPKNKP